MGRQKTNELDRAVIGARFKKRLEQWKSEEYGRNNDKFAELLQVTRSSVQKWCKGMMPSQQKVKEICEVFGVSSDYFDVDNITHGEKYQYSEAFITDLGRAHVEFANEIGLDLNLVQSLTNIVDFDQFFPLYVPLKIKPSPIGNLIPWPRNTEFADSAKIDKQLQYLQIEREGKIITLHKCDLAYLKEVQDKIADLVRWLFFDRALEMEREAKNFEEDFNDFVVWPENEDQINALKDLIKKHDRFAYLMLDKKSQEEQTDKTGRSKR